MATVAETKRRPRSVKPSLRRRLEASLENLIALLDELDGDPELEDGHDAEDDPAEWGIADACGMQEQTVGEPSLGATLEIDQRIAWRPGDGPIDGEATGTEDDVARCKPWEARVADRAAADATQGQLRRIIGAGRPDAHLARNRPARYTGQG